MLDFSCIYFSFMLIELLNLFIYLFVFITVFSTQLQCKKVSTF